MIFIKNEAVLLCVTMRERARVRACVAYVLAHMLSNVVIIC